MSTCSQLLELQEEELGYVQCGFCNTILLVSVPCSSLLKVVTVQCGHCASLLSVGLVRASFVPLQQLLSSSFEDDGIKPSVFSEEKQEGFGCCVANVSYGEAAAQGEKCKPAVNKPPEKRQRAPSAYNRFIREEIKRIKTREPSITHKEAFSIAAKSWAQFPRIQHKGDGESCRDRQAKAARHGGGGYADQDDREEAVGAIYMGEDTH